MPKDDGLDEELPAASPEWQSDWSPYDSDDSDPLPQLTTAGASADPAERYLMQVDKIATLNPEQEVELAKRVEAGLFADQKLKAHDTIDRKLRSELWWIFQDGQDAKDHMIEANLRLVVPWAKLYVGRGTLFLDLIQEGNLGLIQAVERFDYTKRVKFSIFAMWWIRQALARAIAEQARTIRISWHMHKVLNKLADAERWTKEHGGGRSGVARIAAELDLAPQKVVEIQNYGRHPLSLHELIPVAWDEIDATCVFIGSGWATELGYLIEDADAVPAGDLVDFTQLHEQLYAVLETLSEREAAVVSMRYGLTGAQPKTLEEIGKVYGLTRERVSHLHTMTINKLRHPSRSHVLRNYLDLEVLDPPQSEQLAQTCLRTR